jgi:hypothetical protein
MSDLSKGGERWLCTVATLEQCVSGLPNSRRGLPVLTSQPHSELIGWKLRAALILGTVDHTEGELMPPATRSP